MQTCISKAISFVCIAILTGQVSEALHLKGADGTAGPDQSRALEVSADTFTEGYTLTQLGMQTDPLDVTEDGSPTVEEFVEGRSKKLCIGGRLAPTFFLIGAQKASTTSFAENLDSSPDIYFPTKSPDSSHVHVKELHFFDHPHKPGPLAFEVWLSHYPKCKDVNAQAVTVDCTPAYSWKDASSSMERISQFYGSHGSSLKFTILLRDPLQRTHSAFYFFQRSNLFPANHTFLMFAKHAIRKAHKSKHGLSNYHNWKPSFSRIIFEASDYHAQLKRIFTIFRPDQFTIAPMLYNVAPETLGFEKTLVESTWSSLNVQAGTVTNSRAGQPPSSMENKSSIAESPIPHNSLEQDLDIKTRRQIQAAFNKMTGARKLAALLSNSGAKLYGYGGASNDRVAIERWLSQGW